MNAILNNKPEDKPKNRIKEILEEKGIKQTRLVKKTRKEFFVSSILMFATDTGRVWMCYSKSHIFYKLILRI